MAAAVAAALADAGGCSESRPSAAPKTAQTPAPATHIPAAISPCCQEDAWWLLPQGPRACIQGSLPSILPSPPPHACAGTLGAPQAAVCDGLAGRRRRAAEAGDRLSAEQAVAPSLHSSVLFERRRRTLLRQLAPTSMKRKSTSVCSGSAEALINEAKRELCTKERPSRARDDCSEG